MLSVCGRRNDIQLRKQTKSVQQNLHGFQTSTLRQSQALHTTTQLSAQSLKEALTAIKGLEISNKDGLETLQAHVSANTETMLANAQLIRQDNLTVQQQMMKVSDLATVAHAQMDTKLEEVVACVTRTGLGNSKQNGWDLHVKQAGVESSMLPLLLMKDPLQEVLSTLISDEEEGDLESGHLSSIWSEFNALLASSHQAAAHLAKDQSLVPFGQRVVPGLYHESRRGRSRQEHWRRERGNRLLNGRDDSQVLTAPIKRLCHTRNLHRATSQGLLVLDLEFDLESAIRGCIPRHFLHHLVLSKRRDL